MTYFSVDAWESSLLIKIKLQAVKWVHHCLHVEDADGAYVTAMATAKATAKAPPALENLTPWAIP